MARTLAELQNRYSAPGISFDDDRGLVRIRVQTPLCQGEMYLHGAHVTHWQPAGEAPVLWMSQQSNFQPDKPIRGGIPICFPWFGPHPSDSALPAHGLARIGSWELAAIAETREGAIQLICARLVNPFNVMFTVEFGLQLTFGLKISLPPDHPGPVTFQDALHTYFTISDIRDVKITGLEQTEFVDKVDAAKIKPAAGAPIAFQSETDRVYLDTVDACTLHDPGMDRQIMVNKAGSQSTIVWNPWIDKSARMPDFGDDEWPGMVCIETGNVGSNAVQLAPGQVHNTIAQVTVARLSKPSGAVNS